MNDSLQDEMEQGFMDAVVSLLPIIKDDSECIFREVNKDLFPHHPQDFGDNIRQIAEKELVLVRRINRWAIVAHDIGYFPASESECNEILDAFDQTETNAEDLETFLDYCNNPLSRSSEQVYITRALKAAQDNKRNIHKISTALKASLAQA